MEPDFSGYVTKAGLKCADGRTIMPDAFKHQDKMQVPLVWQHGHKDPQNVLGHVLLENRDDGVYGYGYFNTTDKAQHTKTAVIHKDINMMSIWANELIERSKRVMHGAIKEVSLVLAGANPGALIDNITIRHSADDEEVLDDEAIIYTGLEFELEHADNSGNGNGGGNGGGGDGPTVEEVYNSFTDVQKQVVHFMIGEALASADSAAHSDLELGDDATPQDVYDSMTEQQQQVLHHMVGEALATAKTEQSSDETKGNQMRHNVFESTKDGKETAQHVLSHSDIELIVSEAKKPGATLKSAVEDYALAHGIEDIDIMFPDAVAVTNSPELFARRTEWVQKVIGAAKKTPFSRIKSLSADITVAEARAKGYIKGNLKKEEFFRVARRVTGPTTIYKKQKLDRDDIVDITDFDVVAWLKAEMRLMLDEELARAVLVGDGRAVDDEDKIDESAIRPIAFDHEMYTTVLNVNIDDTNSSVNEITDAVILNRKELRGTGLPTLFTTETYIGRYLSLRDTVGRKIYKSIDELATELRVSEIVPVEILEEYPNIVGILVNMVDYSIGSTAGGNVALFDDFDIDYNQYKYLIETRCSGALTKLKSAMVIMKVDAAAVLLAPPADPVFDGDSVTIVNTPNTVYRNADTDAVMNAAGSPYAVAPDATINIVAEPAAGFYFEDSADTNWSFTNNG